MLPLRDRHVSKRIPLANYALIAANVAVFIWSRAILAGGAISPEVWARTYGLVPARFFSEPAAELDTLVTHLFVHDPTGWLHVAGNCLFLWIFGDAVEEAVGRARYLLLYFATGLGAALAHLVLSPSSAVPVVGASGAVFGVLAAYISLYPRSPITVLNPLIPLWFVFGPLIDMPAWIVILEFFALTLWQSISHDASMGTAVYAHLGGFVAGLLLIRVLFHRGRQRTRSKGQAAAGS